MGMTTVKMLTVLNIIIKSFTIILGHVKFDVLMKE